MMQAQLIAGEWIDLMGGGAAGPCEVKWGRNRMRPWLCLNPAAATAPGQREAEEAHRGVWPLLHWQSVPDLPFCTHACPCACLPVR